MPALHWQPAKAEVVAIAIDLADAGYQVVQVGFRALEDSIGTRAVFASAVLPALALMPDLPSRDNMLPLDACGPVRVLTWDVAAGFQVYPVTRVFAAAIELSGLRGVEFPGDFLGFTEGTWGLGVGGSSKKNTEQGDKTDTH